MQKEKEAPFTAAPVPYQLNRDIIYSCIGAIYSKSSIFYKSSWRGNNQQEQDAPFTGKVVLLIAVARDAISSNRRRYHLLQEW